MTTELMTQTSTDAPAEFVAEQATLEGLYLYPLAAEQADAGAVYQWQTYQQGEWSGVSQGDADSLLQAFEVLPANVVVVLPASSVVTRRVTVSEVERRHYKKLIPFQLEEDIIEDVEDLHFVFSSLVGDSVDLAYTDKALLSQWLTPLLEKNMSISLVTSEACLLPVLGESGWCFLLKGDRIDYRFSRNLYGTLALSLAPLFFKSLMAKREVPTQIELIAESNDGLAELAQALPQALQAVVQKRRVLATPLAATTLNSVNLAVGYFFPRIPIARWWAQLRLPTLLLGIGLAVHLAVALTEWQLASSRTEDVKAAITERYRAAVPVGAISDPLKQLRNQVDRLGNTGSASNALFILSHSVPVLTAIDGVEVKNLQFINDAQELRLTIQAPALADVDALSANFKAKGFGAEVLSVNVNQGVHQARLKVTRK
ncbi:type II secretion system protein GspL [Simiduia curdlanivorans]|uniref:Type II secretion system protein L n=1 Tax=Simiduia curdlanivorans TaxID=1492769 RepID=A0ABV8V0L4_9GAMM|nr:type II secretion system protein GspL [Simiduia curdlanivorans]MDN3638056.1 type II secretion system protein GspL [Simiduia curdlanivorans]